jgi:hypothetical protein
MTKFGQGKQLLVEQLIMKRLNRSAITDGRDGSRISMMLTAISSQELTRHVRPNRDLSDHRTN